MLNHRSCLFSDVFSYQVTKSVTTTIPVLGDNIFILQLNFEFTSKYYEQLTGLSLGRKTSDELAFTPIVEFPPPSSVNDPAIYKDTSLESRTVAKYPDSSLSASASLTFNDTLCSDMARYKWAYSIYIPGNGTVIGEQTSVVNIKVELFFLLKGFCIETEDDKYVFLP